VWSAGTDVEVVICGGKELEMSGEARGGVDQRRQALGRGNTRASGRKRHEVMI